MTTVGIVRSGDAWIIVSDGRRCGRYRFRVDAEEAALRLAAKARRQGRQAQVLLQGAAGLLTPLRTG